MNWLAMIAVICSQDNACRHTLRICADKEVKAAQAFAEQQTEERDRKWELDEAPRSCWPGPVRPYGCSIRNPFPGPIVSTMTYEGAVEDCAIKKGLF